MQFAPKLRTMAQGQKLGTPERDWPAIRKDYETTRIGRRELAKKWNIPYSTIELRAKKECWIQGAKLVQNSLKTVEQKIEQRVQERIQNELAPWIEAEKVKFTKEGVKVANIGLRRVKRYFGKTPNVDAKGEAMIAKAADSYHRIGRVALGMGDGSASVGEVNFNILTNRSAVQVVAEQPENGPI